MTRTGESDLQQKPPLHECDTPKLRNDQTPLNTLPAASLERTKNTNPLPGAENRLWQGLAFRCGCK